MRRNASNATIAVLLGLILSSGGLLVCEPAGAAANAVLGSAAFAKPHGEGWGTSRPAKLYNGGDPSGLVKEIQWTSWGGDTAIGYGLGWIFKPHGGYYSRPVLVELRAQSLGRCSPHGPSAYTQLVVRAPAQPEGPLGAWSLWAEAKSLCDLGSRAPHISRLARWLPYALSPVSVGGVGPVLAVVAGKDQTRADPSEVVCQRPEKRDRACLVVFVSLERRPCGR